MFPGNGNIAFQKTTTHQAVIPFYLYAAISFLAATILLFFSGGSFRQHFFNPHTLALTHLLALGWGTMIILGASHQLVPVLTGSGLFSEKLAKLTFLLTGAGIPLLVCSFYFFHTGPLMISGAALVNLGIFLFLLNILRTIRQSKKENVHALFLFTATAWLQLTTLLGLALAINFTHPFLPAGVLSYLPLHAHFGIVGWFLLLIIGVGSRLIPLFLISKFTSEKLLRVIYILVNVGLIGFLLDHLISGFSQRIMIYAIVIFAGIFLFAVYCVKAFRERIRRHVDSQMKTSLLSVLLMFAPVLVLSAVFLFFKNTTANSPLVHLYGFSILMGWITALVLGMSFKTFPFIVWNKIYHGHASQGKTPSPKDLFSEKLFRGMMFTYLAGFILAGTGIILQHLFVIQCGAFLLALSAVLYNCNLFKVLFHKITAR